MSPGPITPVVLRGVAQRFGRKVVLRGVDLELPTASVTGLVGANGAGKTTLFSIIAGLRQPDAGERWFAGRAAPEIDLELRARIAFVAHAPQLYPSLSGRDNLKLFADLRRAAGLSSRPADATLRALGLPEEALGRPVSTYSRGMAQRVALARAVAGDPDLLLLDEPFTALDPRGRGQLAEALLAERRRGASILLSSHDLGTLLRVCDRVVLLADGKISPAIERGADDPDGRDFTARVTAIASAVGPAEEVA